MNATSPAAGYSNTEPFVIQIHFVATAMLHAADHLNDAIADASKASKVTPGGSRFGRSRPHRRQGTSAAAAFPA